MSGPRDTLKAKSPSHQSFEDLSSAMLSTAAARKRARLSYLPAIRATDEHVDPDVFGRRRKARAQRLDLAVDNDDDFFAEDDEVLDNFVVELDTLTSIRYVLENLLVPPLPENRNAAARLPRMCMVHQLYSFLPDNTANDLVKNGTLRKFRIGGTLDEEFAVMLTEAYIKQIKDAQAEFDEDMKAGRGTRKGKGVGENLFARFETFISNGAHTDVSITRHLLTVDMSASDEEISQLIISGLLTTKEPDTFWFAIRRAGNFVHYFLGGRNEILRGLRRTRHKEMLEKVRVHSNMDGV
ncbi:serine-threonine protein kinase 19-domain-containing protein [Jimgerdemannia flammicorona]|uniref:Serine-threonine protein kinase 19-domain-containing protein n=1 Tax=Jimgerdemannia flammicorona TaxID=994334 RepID=A0A433CY62_9FUNG|nr:serine-threonine protein kinase 19-domain-containing protein [Jimgerdemannia flammicorona]